MIKFLFLLFLLTSCSFRQDTKTPYSPITHPDLTVESAKYTLYQEGEFPLFITADLIQIYEVQNKAEAENVSFYQKDNDGNTILEGKAGKLIIDTKTKKSEFYESVEFIRPENNQKISTDKLFFDIDKQIIRAENEVEIAFLDGCIKCLGLEAELKTNSFITGKIIKGEVMK